MQQRFLTDDEINDARAMIGWQFWFAPIMVSLASVGGAVALSDELHGIRFRISFGIVAIALWTVRLVSRRGSLPTSNIESLRCWKEYLNGCG
jgi:hypothetical protein